MYVNIERNYISRYHKVKYLQISNNVSLKRKRKLSQLIAFFFTVINCGSSQYLAVLLSKYCIYARKQNRGNA